MKAFLLGFCLVAAALAQDNKCASSEARVEAEVQRVRVAADDVGVFRTIGDQALSALSQCPDSARLWYLAARSAEVLEGPMGGKVFATEGGTKKIVADALAHSPSSAPIATVAARVQNSSSLARKALELDPTYQPARRALAALLAKEGSFDEALRLTDRPQSSPMRLTRAQVLLAAKRPAEAVGEARKVVTSDPPDELSPRREMYRDTEEVLGFALLDLHRKQEAHKALQAAAAAGSAAAQGYLAKQSSSPK
jgi:tetratricopeptide (TPR) repeat protein